MSTTEKPGVASSSPAYKCTAEARHSVRWMYPKCFMRQTAEPYLHLHLRRGLCLLVVRRALGLLRDRERSLELAVRHSTRAGGHRSAVDRNSVLSGGPGPAVVGLCVARMALLLLLLLLHRLLVSLCRCA